MSNFIEENRSLLSERHYIRKANSDNYWFDFQSGVLKEYLSKTSEDELCLIVFRSGLNDDAYILPYRRFRDMFRDTYLDKRNRWIGTITRNTLKLHGPGLGTSLTDCYNDFSLLERNASSEREKDEGEVAIPIRADDVSIEDLRDYVVRYNTRYKNAVPVLKRRMSEQIARPGLITDLLKKLHQHTCQLCRKPGFMQRNGIPYVESHHIVELHQLVAGSYCSDNIVVVCADCHRKLHYAQILYAAEGLEITVRINETEIYRFQRNVLSTDSLQA